MNLSLYLEESNEQDTITLYWRFAVGATGALSNKSPVRNRGLKAGVTLASMRNSAGSYTFPLAGTVPGGFLSGGGQAIGAVGTNGAIGSVTVDSSTSTSAPAVTIVFTPLNSVTPTDVTNGSDISITLTLKNGIV